MANGHGGRRSGSGRPAGSRNRATLAREAGAVTLAELARESTADAIMALREVMLDAEAPASARISAATALLDRAYGEKRGRAVPFGPLGGGWFVSAGRRACAFSLSLYRYGHTHWALTG